MHLRAYVHLHAYMCHSEIILMSRNLDKKKTLDAKAMGLLMIRIITDSISRMAFLTAVMYARNGCLE